MSRYFCHEANQGMEPDALKRAAHARRSAAAERTYLLNTRIFDREISDE
jgi:hypothetical protein